MAATTRTRLSSLQSFHEQSLSVMNAMVSREWSSIPEDREVTVRVNRGSVTGAIFILMNAVLGASILVLPHAYGQVGIVTAIIMELFVVVLSHVTHMILADAVDRYGGTNYQELIGRVCGPRAQMLAQIALFLYTFGLACATHITIGDQLEKVCLLIDGRNSSSPTGQPTRHWYCDRQFLIPIASMIFVFPLIWIRNISSFSYASVLSVISVFYLVGAIVADYYTGSYPEVTDNIWIAADVGVLPIMAFLPVFTLGFQCHMTSVPLYYELYHRSVARYSLVITVSNILVVVCYLIAGIYGLMTFGPVVQSDVIRSYFPHDKLMTASRAAIAISVTMSYPIFVFLGRSAIEDTLLQLGSRFNFTLQPNSEIRRALILCTWHFTALLISCLTESLESVISLVGSIAAIFMLFFPGLILWVESRAGNWGYKVTGVLLACMGVFTFIWTIVYNAYKIGSGTS